MIIVSTLVGIALDFANINPVKALYWTAVINGLLAPFLLLGIVFYARRPAADGGPAELEAQPGVVSLTTLLMFGAAVGMFVF